MFGVKTVRKDLPPGGPQKFVWVKQAADEVLVRFGKGQWTYHWLDTTILRMEEFKFLMIFEHPFWVSHFKMLTTPGRVQPPKISPPEAGVKLLAKLSSINETSWMQIGTPLYSPIYDLHCWKTCLGVLWELMQENDKATHAFENVLRLNPHNVQALTQLASICTIQERYPQVFTNPVFLWCGRFGGGWVWCSEFGAVLTSWVLEIHVPTDVSNNL